MHRRKQEGRGLVRLVVVLVASCGAGCAGAVLAGLHPVVPEPPANDRDRLAAAALTDALRDRDFPVVLVEGHLLVLRTDSVGPRALPGSESIPFIFVTAADVSALAYRRTPERPKYIRVDMAFNADGTAVVELGLHMALRRDEVLGCDWIIKKEYGWSASGWRFLRQLSQAVC